MTSRLTQFRIVSAMMVVALAGWASAQANEPVAAPPADLSIAPPAPNVSPAPPLAPVTTDAGSSVRPTLDGPMIGTPVDATERTASRSVGIDARGSTPLAPYSIGGSTSVSESSTYFPAATYAPISTSTSTIPTYPASMPTYVPTGDFHPDEATVRISDRAVESTFGDVPGVRPSSRICPHCRYCQHGLPYHECPECEPAAAMMRRYKRRHGVTLPPDYGWSPPGYYPIDRFSIDYYRAFPDRWTGQAPSGPPIVRPTVYWPTDTTQLGVYYQRVPQWLPYPGMVPPVPHPGQWHLPLCNAQGACGPHGACPNCPPKGAETLYSDPSGGTTPQKSTPAPTPVPDQTALLPSGPELRSPSSVPTLTPVPF